MKLVRFGAPDREKPGMLDAKDRFCDRRVESEPGARAARRQRASSYCKPSSSSASRTFGRAATRSAKAFRFGHLLKSMPSPVAHRDITYR
jgi:hypothetical protein